MKEQITINNPDSEYETLTLVSKNGKDELEVFGSVDGSVELLMESYGECISMFLNQDQIKALITYLQKQVK